MRLFREWRVAEINSVGGLHPFLHWLPKLDYSEYGSTHPSARSEDLANLSYPSNHFDLVVTSETLEHVPNVRLALEEVHRVLRPGGHHIFTVPYVIGRKTRTRAQVVDGVVNHALPPSFHGAASVNQTDMLVFHEFGDDFSDLCRNVGFATHLHVDPSNPSVGTFVTQRLALKEKGDDKSAM